MTTDLKPPLAPLHPGHHWGPFANDPWTPDLDPVTGEIWELACRAGRVGVRHPEIPAYLPLTEDDFTVLDARSA